MPLSDDVSRVARLLHCSDTALSSSFLDTPEESGNRNWKNARKHHKLIMIVSRNQCLVINVLKVSGSRGLPSFLRNWSSPDPSCRGICMIAFSCMYNIGNTRPLQPYLVNALLQF